MIITEKIEIKIHPFTLKHYNFLGYNVKVNDIILIPVEHLQKGSQKKIEVKCDICGKEKELKYQTYNLSISKYNIYACSSKCAYFKNKQTCLEKYDVEYVLQLSKIREKGKITKKEKYDDENYTNRKKFLESMERKWEERNKKLIQTNLKNIGVEFPFQSQEIQDKCKQTLFENHGVENAFQIPEVVYKNFETKFGYPYEQYLEQLPDFLLYKNMVWKFTRKQPLNTLENYNKRGIREYHLDHKYSLKEGFKNNICPYIIGNIINLEMLTWENNISKNYKCSITEKELFENYDNNYIYNYIV